MANYNIILFYYTKSNLARNGRTRVSECVLEVV
jgi:hypothetical protein